MLAKFSVKKPFTVFVAVVLIIILGFVAFTNMTPDLLPNIEMQMAIVVTTYPGASPEEVELEVTKPLEQNMATIENIKSIRSTSNNSVSMVILEFNDGANLDTLTVHMREKIESIRGGWDSKISNPYILRINPDIIPVTVAAVTNGDLSTIELSTFVTEDLLMSLESIEGVASVNVSGTVQESVHVILNQEKIKLVNEKVQDAITEQFGAAYKGMGGVAGGKSAIDAGKQQLTDGQKKAAQQFEAARIQLSRSREQLVMLQQYAPAIRVIDAGVTAAQARMDEIKADVIAANPGASDAVIEQELNANLEYTTLKQTLDGLDTQLAAFGLSVSMLPGVMQELPLLGDKIKLIDDTLSDLNVQESVMMAQLGNLYAEAAAGSMALELTIKQLESALSQIESAQQAAYDSADLTGMLTINTISQILMAQDFSMPAGFIGEGEDQYLVSVGDKIASVDELKNMVLMNMGLEGIEPIRLCDVADVFVADNAAQVYAKIDGSDGVLLSFSKQSGYATAEVSKNIRDRFAELSAKHDGLKFTALMDQGDYIGIVVNSVLDNLLIGALLAIVILFLFLRDVRPTLITAISIPISVMFAIVLMYFTGVTLNIISLAGLAVGVGMLVDNSIVVIENIYRLRSLGLPSVRAAMSGAAQVSGAITASTLTTICVFFPIVFVQGITRQLFVDMALTIAYSLLASLVIALTLVPAMATGMLKKDANPTNASGKFATFLEKYKKSVEYALDHKRILILATVLLLLISGVAAAFKGFSYMPSMGGSQIMIDINMPEGTPLSETAETCDEIASRIAELDEVETVGTMLSDGMTGVIGLGSLSGSENTTSVTMYALLNGNNTSRAIKKINAIAGEYEFDIKADGSSMMSSFSGALGGSGVDIRIYGNNIDDLRKTAIDVAKIVERVDGVIDVSNGVEDSQPELRISVNKNKAMENNLTVAQVYMQIASVLAKSQTPIELVYSGDSHDVIVNSEAVNKTTVSDLRNLEFTVDTYSGEKATVKLSEIATITEAETLSTISRSEQRRYVTVSSGLKEGYNVTLVNNDVRLLVDQYKLPEGVTIEYTGESETIMSSLSDLGLMLLLGIVIVYLIMVAQFQSLSSPFIVLFTIPLAFTGGLIALLICGMEISIVAMIGFVMLVGIIVNNGIVLVDYINQLRAEGKDKREAILEAGITRLRPVLMTALTTILGLLPLALGGGMGGEMMQPVAIVCIGGLIYATIMTLFIVPVMYDLFIRKDIRVVTQEDLEVVAL